MITTTTTKTVIMKKKIKTVNIMINIINFWLWKFMLYITEVKYAKYP